jgi:hypothetical protein
MSSAIAAPLPPPDRLAPPWFAATAEQARRFGAHLQRELGPRHVLYGRAVTAVAARADGDHVVFALDDGSGAALVHLTYARRPAASAEWPPTTLYASLTDALAATGR